MMSLFRLVFFFIIISLGNITFAETIGVVTENYPPLNYVKNGKIDGIATKIVQATFEEMKQPYNIVVYPWSKAMWFAKTHENIFIYTMAKNSSREKDFNFVEILDLSNLTFFRLKHKENVQVNSLTDLRKYRIGVILNDVVEQNLRSKGFIRDKNLTYYKTYDLALEALLEEDIDLWPMQDLSGKFMLEQNNITNVVPAYHHKKYSSGYIALNKKSDIALLKRFERALNSLKEKGIYQKIVEEYR